MELEFIRISEGEDLSPLSFWLQPTRYDFYIVYEDDEEKMLEIFEKEFKLNCKEQLL